MTILNRSELALTSSLEELARIRGALSENGIEYAIKTRNLAVNRGWITNTARAEQFSIEYRFFVHKDDLERALAAIGGRLGV